jgi:hypothetical protein
MYSEIRAGYRTVHFAVDGPGGTIVAAANGSSITSGEHIAEGSNIVFTASPQAGYVIDTWIVNGQDIQQSNPTLTRSNLNRPLNVMVRFKEQERITSTPEIEHEAQSPISVHPNPTSHTLYIENKNFQNGQFVDLYDMTGRLIMRTPSTSEYQTINVSHLPAGVYIIKIQEWTERLIVDR